MNLELAARLWLAREKRCMIVVHELSPRSNYCGEPDAYGVTRARYAVEVEVKRSMSDFAADKHKRSRRNRVIWQQFFPKFFFYLLPGDLAPRAMPSLPDWAGLLSLGDYGVVTVLREAPANRLAIRLSLKECAQLAAQTSVCATRLEQRLDVVNRRWGEAYEPHHWHWSI